MNLSTIDSNRLFIAAVFGGVLFTCAFGFLYLEKSAERMAREANFQYSELVKNPDQEVAAIGSSHLLRGARNFINFSQVALLSGAFTIPPVMYFKLKKATESLPKLKAVYLEADYHLFFNGSTYSWDKGIPRWAAFFDSSAEKEFGSLYAPPKTSQWYAVQEDVAPILFKRIVKEVYPWNSVPGTDKASVSGKNVCNEVDWHEYAADLMPYFLFQEFNWHLWSDAEREVKTRNRIETFGLVKGAKMDQGMQSAYRRTIELALAHKLRVTLVRMPLSEMYQENIPDEVVVQVDRYLAGLVKEFGVELLDYRGLFHGRNQMFDDGDHLNKAGGMLFSMLLRDSYCRKH